MFFRWLLLGLLTVSGLDVHAAWRSQRVSYDSNGRLIYPTDSKGNRVPDFSFAGYGGGGVEWPTGTVRITLEAGASAAQINAAIATAAASGTPSNPSVVVLKAGTYTLKGTEQILLNGNNVILRGAGSGTDATSSTIIHHTGTTRLSVIKLGGGGDYYWTRTSGTSQNITDAVLPVGSRVFTVADASQFKTGDVVLVRHPSTEKWLEAMDWGGVPSGSKPWAAGTKDVRYHRIIERIDGNKITVDAPIFIEFRRSLSQANVVKFAGSGRTSNAGVENLRVSVGGATDMSEKRPDIAVEFVHGDNFWAENVAVERFSYSGFLMSQGVTRSTVRNCKATDPRPSSGMGRWNFSAQNAQLVLFENCYSSGARHPFSTDAGNSEAGPSGIVFLDCISDLGTHLMHGHSHLAQGVLYDGCIVNVPAGGQTEHVALANCGNFGTAGNTHGWGNINSVLWNLTINGSDNEVVVQEPPLGQNFAIGVTGGKVVKTDKSGTFSYGRGVPLGGLATVILGWVEGVDKPGLEPRSLYRAQLVDRLGIGVVPMAPSELTFGTAL